MDNTKPPKSYENRNVKGKLKHYQQSNAVNTVLDENKVPTKRYNGAANCSKNFVWKSRQQEYHFQKAKQVVAKSDEKTSKSHESTTTSESKVNVSGSLNANAFRQPKIVTSRNDQQKYVGIDHSKSFHRVKSNKPLTESKNNAVATYANATSSHKPGSSNSSTIINKSNAKSNAFHHAMSNEKLVSEVIITAKTSKGSFKNSLLKDGLEGSDKLQTSLCSKKSSDAKINSSVQQRVKRQHRLSGKKNISPKLNIHHSEKHFLSNYNALFMKKQLKVGHNSRKRILHRPEISYIYEDKMCWFRPRRFQQPRRLLKYRYAAKLTGDLNPLSTGSLLLPPKVDLECHIFGFPKDLQTFNDCFKKLCEIIGVKDMNILNVRNENGAKVIQLIDSNQRNHFLAAYENYERLVKAGKVLPLTSKLCGGVTKKNKICVRPGPKNVKKTGHKDKQIENGIEILLSVENWTSVLYRQRPILVSGTERRGYGALINASNILCHAF